MELKIYVTNLNGETEYYLNMYEDATPKPKWVVIKIDKLKAKELSEEFNLETKTINPRP